MSHEPIRSVAIVTGASRGLGFAMARGLAGAGFSVLMTASTNDGSIEKAAQAIDAETGRACTLAVVADVTAEDACRSVVAQAIERFAGLHVLVNNAGRGMRTVSERFLTEPTRFWEIEPATWRMLIDANVNGPFLMARAAVPHFLTQGWGRVINISMNRETMRRRGFSPYGPSKAALESETAIWAQDLADTGVTVNALLPGGATRTGMIPGGTPPSMLASLLDPTVVVPPLLWLASRQSDGVTGKRLDAARWSPEISGLESAG